MVYDFRTSLGSYRQGWAVLVDRDGKERLYFDGESKGSMLVDMLRPTEQAKINFGREHFKGLCCDVDFTVADSFDKFNEKTMV